MSLDVPLSTPIKMLKKDLPSEAMAWYLNTMQPESKKMDALAKLQAVAAAGEGARVEFKQGCSSSLASEMVAFANTRGGKIYIGIDDNGKLVGINITNDLKSQIQNVARACDPPINIRLQTWPAQRVLCIAIAESKQKPHRCSGGFYIRQGANSQKLRRDEIKSLMTTQGLIAFEKEACKKFIYEKHLDKKKLLRFLKKSKISHGKNNIQQALINLEVAAKKRGKLVVNNAGAMFFSKDLDSIYFHTKVSCALFKGSTRTNILDRKLFNRDVLSSIDDALMFLKSHLRLEYQFPSQQIQRKEVLEIPEPALREALTNAVVHRDYVNTAHHVDVEIHDTYVDIINFGGLPPGVTKKNFGSTSVPRNPLVADLMLRCGYIERMGTGVRRMKEAAQHAGLKPIAFKFDNFSRVRFYRKPIYDAVPQSKPSTNKKSSSSKLAVVPKGSKKVYFDYIMAAIKNEKFSTPQAALDLKVSEKTIKRQLQILKAANCIYFDGPTKTGRYRIAQ